MARELATASPAREEQERATSASRNQSGQRLPMASGRTAFVAAAAAAGRRGPDRVSRRQVDLLRGLQQSVGNQAVQRLIQRQASSSDAQRLPEDVQQTMEQAFQANLSSVRIHTDSDRAMAAGALAFTQGEQVHFAPGQYEPGDERGRLRLAHELAHVVQQRGRPMSASAVRSGLAVAVDPAREHEADLMGAAAAHGSAATASMTASTRSAEELVNSSTPAQLMQIYTLEAHDGGTLLAVDPEGRYTIINADALATLGLNAGDRVEGELELVGNAPQVRVTRKSELREWTGITTRRAMTRMGKQSRRADRAKTSPFKATPKPPKVVNGQSVFNGDRNTLKYDQDGYDKKLKSLGTSVCPHTGKTLYTVYVDKTLAKTVDLPRKSDWDANSALQAHYDSFATLDHDPPFSDEVLSAPTQAVIHDGYNWTIVMKKDAETIFNNFTKMVPMANRGNSSKGGLKGQVGGPIKGKPVK